MDKSRDTKPDESEQASRSSGRTNAVLNVLKRFRSKRGDAAESTPFDAPPGDANGPLARRVSELSGRIEARRAQDPKEPAPADGGETGSDTDRTDTPATGDSGAKGSRRTRSMVFHDPVHAATSPEKPEMPDFKAASEPPRVQLFAAPDGVMENSGAPEKRVTAPKEKSVEPIDLQAFADQLRSKLPPQASRPADMAATAETPPDHAAPHEKEADAAAFKKDFYARIRKASTTAFFDAIPAAKEPEDTDVTSPLPIQTIRTTATGSALRNWREHRSREPAAEAAERPAGRSETAENAPAPSAEAAPSGAAPAPEPAADAPQPEHAQPTDNAPDAEPRSPDMPPHVQAEADPPVFAQYTANAAHHAKRAAPALAAGDPVPPQAAAGPDLPPDAPATAAPDAPMPVTSRDAAAPAPPAAAGFSAYTPRRADPAAGSAPDDIPHADPSPSETSPSETPPSETPPAKAISHDMPPAEIAPAEQAAHTGDGAAPEPPAPAADTNRADVQTVQDDIPPSETPPSEPPENVFEALDIDEAEIMAKVYDLIQSELQSAWGENITLNIRKMVRDEVRAALARSRDDL